MEQIRLENNEVRIEVAPRGAELQSLYSKRTRREYLWQPGGELWAHHSMLLFPNAGRICRDRILVDGREYPAMMHGFAHEMEFEMVRVCEDELWLGLSSNAYTRSYFPYEFRLLVGYRLEGDTVFWQLRVQNRGDQELYFSIGAHPGFYCPIVLGESADDYVLCFDRPQEMNLLEMEEKTRLLTGAEQKFLHGKREIPLSEGFFDQGPMLLGGVNADTLTLKSRRSGSFVEMGISGFPYLCLWGPPGKMALIAVEPWCGISDPMDTDHIWEKKRGIEHVGVGETFERVLTLRFG